MTTLLRAVGHWALWVTRFFGAVGLVLGRTLINLRHLEFREFMRAAVLFGYRSLPLSFGVSALIGATVILQAGVYANRFGARQYTGWAGGYALMWEFGPLLLGLVMAARIGARNAAELALLSVNGQIEGLRGVSLDPFRLLVAPRVVASALAVTALSASTFLVSILWEAVAAFVTLKLPVRVFFAGFADLLGAGDLFGGIAKSFCFGVAIALVSTAAGLRASGGARGVGQAAATAVVSSCGAIFVLDYLLTPVLARLFT